MSVYTTIGPLVKLINTQKYGYISINCSDFLHSSFSGLEGFYNYIQLTIEQLKLRSYSLKAVEKLTIVSDEGMFQKLLSQHSDSQTEAANVTFTGKVSGAFASK